MASQAGTEEQGGSHSMIGRRVGAYRLLGSLGRGGMGEVYRAQRDDEQFEKLVAVKLVRRDVENEFVLGRFRSERQILARLEHPGIARLIDGGVTEEGRPFLVMEYVEGTRIDTWANERTFDTRARLELFRRVCAAVQYAHQNLVVHRDIKPSNILVTADGSPKLMDFGIGKLLDAETSDATVAGATLMTPAYASPEQVRAEVVTTASDVYSLGVVLYELLTGHTPYRLKSLMPLAVMKAVVEQEPDRPSTVARRRAEAAERQPDDTERETVPAPLTQVSPLGGSRRMRSRGLEADLDHVLLMALRKEPERRYASVEAFSEDLRRCLQGYPVQARKGTFGYRARKFARRNRLALAAAAGVLALIVGFAVSTAVQARRVARERDKAEQVSAFLVEIFRSTDPLRGADTNAVTAREMLDRGAARLETLKAQPEVRAGLQNAIGMAYEHLAVRDKGLPMLEEALATRQRLLGEEHPDVLSSMHNVAVAARRWGDYPRAEALNRKILEVRRRTLGNEHPDVAVSLNNLANVLYNRGDVASAEALHREALAIRRKVFGNESLEVARSLHNLGSVLNKKGDMVQPEILYRESLAVRRKLLDEGHPEIADSVNNLGAVANAKGDYAEAESLYRESLELKRKRLGPEHPDVAVSLIRVGGTLSARGDYAGAEALMREGLAVYRRVQGPESAGVGEALDALSMVVNEKGNAVEAEALARESLAIAEKRLGPGSVEVAFHVISLAEALREQRRFAEAEPLYRKALDEVRNKMGPTDIDVADPLSGLGEMLFDKGAPAEAEPVVREALAIRRRGLPATHALIFDTQSLLGACLLALGRPQEAEPLLLESDGVIVRVRSTRSRSARRSAAYLFRLYESTGQPAKAASYRDRR